MIKNSLIKTMSLTIVAMSVTLSNLIYANAEDNINVEQMKSEIVKVYTKTIKLTKLIASLLIAVSILALNPIGANAEWVQTHTDPPLFWYKEGDSWATGWRCINDRWYYLDTNTGYADTGWHNIEGNWYYFQPVRGVLAQSLITPYYYEAENGIYYLNSYGVYIENSPEEIQAYINLLKNRDLLLNLKIIGAGTRVFGGFLVEQTRTVEEDRIAKDNISDNDKDGILEMYTESKFGIKCTVKYNNGKIYVYDNETNLISSTDTISNVNSTTTKNIIEESGLQFDENTGKVIAYKGTNTTLVIPSTFNGIKTTSIGDSAFSLCHDLTSVTIPNSVTSIGDSAFNFCINLKNITIPNSVTSIGKGAFMGCRSLTSITIPDSVTSIGKDAFFYFNNSVFYVNSEKTKNLLVNSGVDKSKIILNDQS